MVLSRNLDAANYSLNLILQVVFPKVAASSVCASLDTFNIQSSRFLGLSASCVYASAPSRRAMAAALVWLVLIHTIKLSITTANPVYFNSFRCCRVRQACNVFNVHITKVRIKFR